MDSRSGKLICCAVVVMMFVGASLICEVTVGQTSSGVTYPSGQDDVELVHCRWDLVER